MTSTLSRPTLSIVIPCYNEEEGIPHLAKKLEPVITTLQQNYVIELILVDDGSTDNTPTLLQRHFGTIPYALILTHEHNKNLGAALRTGFSHANGDFIAALDSDCTYSPELLISMMNLMDDHTQIVTVSPYHPRGSVENVPVYRIFLSKGVSFAYRFLLRSGIYTHGAMVRVYRKKVLDSIHFTSDNFLSVTEIMVKACLQGYIVKELPATLRVRQYGTSKLKLAKTIRSHLSLLSNIILHHTFGTEL